MPFQGNNGVFIVEWCACLRMVAKCTKCEQWEKKRSGKVGTAFLIVSMRKS